MQHKTAILVQAIVHDLWDNRAYAHTWVEDKGLCFDWQTSIGLGKGKRTVNNFYEAYKPTKMKKYNYVETLEHALKSGHYGPW